MTPWISWLSVGLMIAVLVYGILSVYVRKPVGMYIAAAFHIVLGILTLPSIELYVMGFAILELIAGINMTVKFRRKPNT